MAGGVPGLHLHRVRAVIWGRGSVRRLQSGAASALGWGFPLGTKESWGNRSAPARPRARSCQQRGTEGGNGRSPEQRNGPGPGEGGGERGAVGLRGSAPRTGRAAAGRAAGATGLLTAQRDGGGSGYREAGIPPPAGGSRGSAPGPGRFFSRPPPALTGSGPSARAFPGFGGNGGNGSCRQRGGRKGKLAPPEVTP